MYKFNVDDAFRFAQELHIQAAPKGKELVFKKCPYCGSTTNKKDKFAINLETGMFNCFRASCSAHGNMITLSRDFNFSLGKENDAYYRTADYSSKQYKKFKDAHKQIETRPAAIEYLTKRGISEDIILKYEITTLAEKENVLVFPFKDVDGNLTFVKYRNMEFVKGKDNSKEWCEANCKPILFGMNHCSGNENLIITEGQIDSLSVVMAGYEDAVSVPTGKNGFTWVPYCYNFVNKYKQITIMGDCENGIITLADELAKRWPLKIRVCRQEDYRGCKDANEILQKYGAIAIKNAIENADAPYNSHIKPLAKVKQVDIMAIPAISTGMPELDKALDGGFRLGQLAVLTGKRGDGKSTLASMFGVRALEQNYNSMFYSGELMDFYFRNWMDCQVTGKDKHSPSDHDKLDKWYGDKAFIYDETIAEGDELQSLLATIEISIIQQNCQFIMIDNLMTAIDDDLSMDLYRGQSKFVGDLAALAKKHNVFILLIAHPKKTFNQELTNDDVSGSSNITDKADIVLTYSRPKKEEDSDEDHRRLSITKNRLTGKLRTDKYSIPLSFDSSGSRRIKDDTQSFHDIHFTWNDDPYGFSEVDSDDAIPF